jgi:hypothetical protein
LEGKSLE